MKKILFAAFAVALFCALYSCAPTKSQGFVNISKFNNDTLAYYKANIINNKTKYVGKKLRRLMWDLYITDKYQPYYQRYTIATGNGQAYNHLLFGYFYRGRKMLIDVRLNNPPPPQKVLDAIEMRNGKWNKDIANFYPSQIVSDITMEE